MAEPRYTHDCDECYFLGHADADDVYVCMQGERGASAIPTIIRRFGSKGWEYGSGMNLLPSLPTVMQGYARAWVNEQRAEDSSMTDEQPGEEPQWSDNHGPDEFYDKFRVYRVSTGEEISRTDEFVFVLRPESDEAAWFALQTYAHAAAHRSPELAAAINDRLRAIYVRQGTPRLDRREGMPARIRDRDDTPKGSGPYGV